MFRGVAQLSMDGKGRLAIPTKYRDALRAQGDGRLVVTADPSRCLLLYTLPEWEPIYDQLMKLPSFDDRVRGLQRLIEEDADCEKIAQQMAAARKALDKSFFSMVGCMIEQGDQSADHVAEMLTKFA